MKCLKTAAALACVICAVSGCDGIYSADVYTVAVDPYVPVNEGDLRIGECSITFGDEVSVKGSGAWYKDNDIIISKGGIYRISGSYDKGCINITAEDAVKLIFDGADISNHDGFAVTSGTGKLILASDSESVISGCGGDNENAVYSAGDMLIVGTGSMCIKGGVFSEGSINFGRNVTTFCKIVHTESGNMIPGTLYVN